MRRKRHYLFIKDNETVILSVIKDNMRRWDIVCSSRQTKLKYYLFIKDNMRKGKHYLFIKIIKLKYYLLTKIIEDETLSVYQRQWSWTSFVIKNNMKGKRHYLFIKDSET
jgi:hypothetical protein